MGAYWQSQDSFYTKGMTQVPYPGLTEGHVKPSVAILHSPSHSMLTGYYCIAYYGLGRSNAPPRMTMSGQVMFISAQSRPCFTDPCTHQFLSSQYVLTPRRHWPVVCSRQ